MATNCYVIIKVKPEDIGETKKYDQTALPKGIKEISFAENWASQEESEQNSTEDVVLRPYMSIYIHNDGTPKYVGKTLYRHFGYEQTLNLVVGGDCSVVDEDHVVRYASRGEDWDTIAPMKASEEWEILSWVGRKNIIYMFKDGEWYCNLEKGDEFTLLKF